MILNNELYTITSISDNEVCIRLLPESVIYKAHFPEWPITPGVCVIQMTTELLAKLLGVNLLLTEVVNAKYLAVIDPRETSELTFSFDKITSLGDTDCVKATVTVRSGETVYTKLSLAYNKI